MCQNPFADPPCTNQDEHLGIVYKGKTLWICSKCWEQIADTDLSWGEENVQKRRS